MSFKASGFKFQSFKVAKFKVSSFKTLILKFQSFNFIVSNVKLHFLFSNSKLQDSSFKLQASSFNLQVSNFMLAFQRSSFSFILVWFPPCGGFFAGVMHTLSFWYYTILHNVPLAFCTIFSLLLFCNIAYYLERCAVTHTIF